MNPLKFKLLTRMRSYLRWMQMISQSTLLIALRNRIEAVRHSSVYSDLDRVALLGPGGGRFRVRGPFFRRKARIDRQVVGRTFLLDEQRFIFFGLDVDIYRMMAAQRFDEITSYRSRLAEQVSKQSEVMAFLTEKELRGENPEQIGATWDPKARGFDLPLVGPVLFERSGLVLGVMKPKSHQKINQPRLPSDPESEEATKLNKEINQGSLSFNRRGKDPVW
jgi:hypothetical protein